MSNAYEFNYESDSQDSVDEAPMEKNDLVLFDHGKNITVIFSPNGSDEILREIKEKVESVVLDVSTQSGREQIRSLAFKIARTKTGLDKMGKNLKAEFKARCDAIDSERAKIWDELERLQEKVRKPLTDFENKEKERVAERESRISQMASVVQTFDSDSTADKIRAQIDFVTHTKEFDWQEFAERADSVARQTLLFLQERLDARLKRDAEIAELDRLRKEKEERERKEREDKIAAEAAENARIAAEKKAEQEKADILAKAKADAEAAEQKRLDDIEEARKKEEARQKKIRDDEAAAEKLRADNLEHKKKINNEAANAIVALYSRVDGIPGITLDQAKAVIAAIAKGEIPHTKINY